MDLIIKNKTINENYINDLENKKSLIFKNCKFINTSLNIPSIEFTNCFFAYDVFIKGDNIKFTKCSGEIKCYSDAIIMINCVIRMYSCYVRTLITNYISGISLDDRNMEIFNVYIINDSLSVSASIICGYLYIKNCEKLKIVYGRYGRVSIDKYILLTHTHHSSIVLYTKRIKSNIIKLDRIIKPDIHFLNIHSIKCSGNQTIISNNNNHLINNVKVLNNTFYDLIYTDRSFKNIIEQYFNYNERKYVIFHNNNSVLELELEKYVLPKTIYQKYANRTLSFVTNKTNSLSLLYICDIQNKNSYSIPFYEIICVSNENINGIFIAIIHDSDEIKCYLFDSRFKLIRGYNIGQYSDNIRIKDIRRIFITKDLFILSSDRIAIFDLQNGNLINIFRYHDIIAVSSDNILFCSHSLGANFTHYGYKFIDINNNTLAELSYSKSYLIKYAYFDGDLLYCKYVYLDKSCIMYIPWRKFIKNC